RACPPASTACHQESSAQVTSLQVNNAGTLGASLVLDELDDLGHRIERASAPQRPEMTFDPSPHRHGGVTLGYTET
ncbi:hypothetical protein, partial [Mycobacterium marinum]